MRIEETFRVGRPPEAVFDYITDAARLAEWQTSKTFVEPLTEGPPRQGSRFREGTKPPLAREFVEVTEFTAFDRPGHLHAATSSEGDSNRTLRRARPAAGVLGC